MSAILTDTISKAAEGQFLLPHPNLNFFFLQGKNGMEKYPQKLDYPSMSKNNLTFATVHNLFSDHPSP